jgi:hypothetical protein
MRTTIDRAVCGTINERRSKRMARRTFVLWLYPVHRRVRRGSMPH